MTDAHTLANAILDGPTKAYALYIADKLEPLPARKLWGVAPSDDPYVVPIDTQMADYVALGITCPRFGGSDAAAASARAHGFKQWVAFVSGSGYASIASIVDYAKRYPEAVVGFGNELNIGGWKVPDVAAKQISVYKAVKAARDANGNPLPNRVGLSCVGNSKSSAEGLLPLEWCANLAAAGCKAGTGFDVADYHMYAGNPQSYDNWMHVWTPDSTGRSCQSVLGHAPFIVSEMGARIGKDVPDANAQAAAATAWVAKLKSLPECLGGMWFQDYEGTDSRWSGFGLHDPAGNQRPSWQAFKSAVA